MFTRRHFLKLSASAAGTFAVAPLWAEEIAVPAIDSNAANFFVLGDTHYLADEKNHAVLDADSRGYNERLIEWLNKLPESEIPAEAGGGRVAALMGAIHVGDITESGEGERGPIETMQRTEWSAFLADYGLNGGDGKLKFPIRELHGNHDSPDGKNFLIEDIRERNKRRTGLTNVSKSGIHYSWDWNGIHFVNLGIVVGETPEVVRPRRYAALGSLEFLIEDLAKHVGDSGRPVVISHHVDVGGHSRALESMADTFKSRWDSVDCLAFYDVLTQYKIAAVFHGHTHRRHFFPWNGTPPSHDPSAPSVIGVPVFNTSKAAHFAHQDHAFLYMSISAKEVVAREFATIDGWKTAAWTPQIWRVSL